MQQKRIAILGAGIMGASTAVMLARRGFQVEMFDLADQPFSGASRWNEGKIHLGFMYPADPSLATAEKVITGGLLFKPIMEQMLECSLESVTTTEDDFFLCHKDSVVAPDDMQEYLGRVAALVRHHPDAGSYLADAAGGGCTRFDSSGLDAITDSPEIVAGFRVPERSVSTVWIADRFTEVLRAEKNIAQHMNTVVQAVHPKSKGVFDGEWYVDTACAKFGPYDYVINALWQGRLAIDLSAGLRTHEIWSNRYRQSLFVQTRKEIYAPSAVIVTGPFGDIKNYDNRNFYLSWYPEGLRINSDLIQPPVPALLDESAMRQKCNAVFDRLEALIPSTREIRSHMTSMALEGGWVFAAGQGDLSDPSSTLHRRKDFGVFRLGKYISIDTGKYSTAPWLAQKIVADIN